MIDIVDEAPDHTGAREGLLDLVERLTAYSNLHLQGLMTIAEHTEDEASRRRCFATLRELAEQVVAAGFEGVEMKHLSFGEDHW